MGAISASLPPGNTVLSEEMLQRWQVVGNSVSNLTGPSFEPQTYRSRGGRIVTQPTGRLNFYDIAFLLVQFSEKFFEKREKNRTRKRKVKRKKEPKTPKRGRVYKKKGKGYIFQSI